MSEPMSAEEFARKLFENKEPDINVDKELTSQYTKLIAQRDRSLLQAAADRVCFDCGVNENGIPCIDECSERKAILAPLNKE